MESDSYSDEAFDEGAVSEGSEFSEHTKPKRKKAIKKGPANTAAARSKPAQPKQPKEPKGAKPTGKKQPNKEVAELKMATHLVKQLEDHLKVQPLKPLNNEDYEALLKCQDAPLFSLNYQTHLAKVLSIYDGDTITAVFFIKGELKKYKIRINGIDTAEMKDSDPEVSMLAHCTVQAIEPLKGKIIKAELGKFDKYGRVLSKIFVLTEDGELDLTKWMIEKGIAKPYDGKKKNVYGKEDVKRLKDTIQAIRLPEVRNYHNPVVQQAQ